MPTPVSSFFSLIPHSASTCSCRNCSQQCLSGCGRWCSGHRAQAGHPPSGVCPGLAPTTHPLTHPPSTSLSHKSSALSRAVATMGTLTILCLCEKERDRQNHLLSWSLVLCTGRGGGEEQRQKLRL